MPALLRYSIFCICLLCCVTSRAEKNRFFSDSDDSLKKYVLQTKWDFAPDASAVVLIEQVSFSIEDDASGFYIVRNVHTAIKILNKKGLHHADVAVPMYFSRKHGVTFKKVSGTTYNVINGQLVKQELSADAIKKEITENNVAMEKFSMPAAKEGSVIEYSYKIEEDFRTDFGWDFESDIPKVYSEVTVIHPVILNVGGIVQSRYAFEPFDDHKNSIADSLVPLAYRATETGFGNNMAGARWVRRNLPACEDEPFVFNVRNYTEKIAIQVSGIYQEGRGNLYATWDKATDYLYHDESCFKPLTKKMRFLEDQVDALITGKTDTLEQAKAIFSFVRNRFDCNGHATIWREGDMEDVYNRKTGNVTEINLILTKMLRQAGMECSPVILSTRQNLRVTEEYPLLSRFNYSVCRLVLNDSTYYLDASDKNNPFGILPAECYNGYARVIDKTPEFVVLNAGMLKERNVFVLRTIDNDPGNYTAGIEQLFGAATAHSLRHQWQKDSTESRRYMAKLIKNLGVESTLLHYSIKNLDDPDKPLTLEAEVKVKWPSSGNILLQPCLYVYYKDNPFSAQNRTYPVEMKYATNFVFSLYLKLPAGYTPGDCPQSAVYRLDDKNEYRYLIEKDTANNAIQLNTNLSLSRAYFEQSSYESLRLFFSKMLDCQKQPVILKKAS